MLSTKFPLFPGTSGPRTWMTSRRRWSHPREAPNIQARKSPKLASAITTGEMRIKRANFCRGLSFNRVFTFRNWFERGVKLLCMYELAPASPSMAHHSVLYQRIFNTISFRILARICRQGQAHPRNWAMKGHFQCVAVLTNFLHQCFSVPLVMSNVDFCSGWIVFIFR